MHTCKPQALVIALAFLALPVMAADFCVGDAASLTAALNVAHNNAEDDSIMIHSGTIVGNFAYNANAAESGDLTLRGGFDATCATSSGNSDDTVIDGGGVGPTLVLSGRDNSTLEIGELTVTGGTAQTQGGGLDIDRWVNVQIINNHIVANGALPGLGGTAGIEVDAGVNVAIERNVFADNAGHDSGGLSISGMDVATVRANIFVRNSAVDGGGGLDLTSESIALIANNLFDANSSAQDGGGMSIRSESVNGSALLQIVNNTLANNQAAQDGGGAELNLTGDVTRSLLLNNLFWNNSAGALGDDLSIDNDDDDNGIAALTDIETNNFDQTPLLGFDSRLPIALSPSNFDALDPLFSGPGNFSLSPASPLIDAGTSAAPGVSSVDLAGAPRFQGAAIDLGALETGIDADGDGIADSNDNCTLRPNGDQRDTTGDGFGNVCDADLNNDGAVNIVDLGLLRLAFFSTDADADFNGDGIVNSTDLGQMRALFGQPPGPSGLVTGR
ncbi:MAG: choice-of-anchor Q domain-containing protein [Gammaproteobacteria bacterium]